MAKSIQISRVTAISKYDPLETKILAVNHKQLSNNIIDPLAIFMVPNIIDPLAIFMVPMGWQCQCRATVGKVSKSMC